MSIVYFGQKGDRHDKDPMCMANGHLFTFSVQKGDGASIGFNHVTCQRSETVPNVPNVRKYWAFVTSPETRENGYLRKSIYVMSLGDHFT